MDKGNTVRNFNILIIIGSGLLLVLALFHGSGFVFVVDKMNQSNAASFLKEIMPVLFLQPSINLLSLACFAGITIFLKERGFPVLVLVCIFSGINLVFALYLEAYVPGAIMFMALACFLLAMRYHKSLR
ncbi:MAG: hypothetical protein AAF634_10850 [Bacteroidota bacterium]